MTYILLQHSLKNRATTSCKYDGNMTLLCCFRASLENSQLTYTTCIFGYNTLLAAEVSQILEIVPRTLSEFPEYSMGFYETN